MSKPTLPGIVSEYAFTASVQVGEPWTVGSIPDGVRRYIPITGGSIEGPPLHGTVLAAGGDWQIIRSDGVVVLEARYLIRTDDDVLISVVNRGLRRAPPAVMSRLMQGEHVPRGDYYFRTLAQFEAPVASRYAYLNDSVYVGTAEREPAAVIVHFYRIS